MDVQPITPDTVREALRAVHYGQSLRRSSLLPLAAVTLRLRADDLADTPQSRSWALAHLLDETVWDHLARLRGRAVPREQLTDADEADLLVADYHSDDLQRQAWGTLYARYLAHSRRPFGTIPDLVGAPGRTVRRRLARGYESLAEALRSAELAAVKDLAYGASAPIQDRIVVDESADRAEVLQVLAEILDALHDPGRVLRVRPSTLAAAGEYPVSELIAYRLSRVAEWSQPRYRLDERFVDMSLLVDMGEESSAGRWQAKEERFTDLRDVLAAVPEPAVVLLGPPGSGKSTLLRRLELDLTVEALTAETGEDVAPFTFLVSLNQYRAPAPGGPLPSPRSWLEERWAIRYPKLPALNEMLADGSVVLLLDGLNEMPHRGLDDHRDRVLAWKQFLHERVAGVPGNRMVIACRSLDYSAPLSTPRLRVPQVQLEPLADEKVREFLDRYSPGNAEALWVEIEGTALLETVRWPFFLRLLVEDAADTGEIDGGLAALFTGFVRRALVREIERDNPLFAPGALLDLRDTARLTGGRAWRTPWELPEGGVLFPELARLAHRMQTDAVAREMSQVRIDYDAALAILGGDRGPDITRAGAALGILDEDRAADEVMFSHQLLQEYFAARAEVKAPEPELMRVEWRAAEIHPNVAEVIDGLDPTDPLPPLPSTGWEETAILAAVMARDPADYLRGITDTNLALAGRAAARSEVRSRLPGDLLDELRWALVRRSRDPEADLRDRIACGLAVGDLGDPRFVWREGPHGEFLAPPMVEIASGVYLIGDDEPYPHISGTTAAHISRHSVEIGPFRIGQFPVTNAEYARFLKSGGYEDERWWDTAAGRDWRQGIGTAASIHRSVRYWLAQFQAKPELLDSLKRNRTYDASFWDTWQQRLVMTEAEFNAHLYDRYPEQRYEEPRYWRDYRYNRTAQPVVGICWYEARAYCAWLAAQTGEVYRLPTEVEWEAAARGPNGRSYAFGEVYHALTANGLETRVTRPTPVGVFVGGDSPNEVSDLSGNVWELASSLSGRMEELVYGYPYRADDGREDAEAGPDILRVMRGGAHLDSLTNVKAAFRGELQASDRGQNIGFRLAASPT